MGAIRKIKREPVKSKSIDSKAFKTELSVRQYDPPVSKTELRSSKVRDVIWPVSIEQTRLLYTAKVAFSVK